MRMKIIRIFFGASVIALAGCFKRHIGTSNICSMNLYYEVFEVNPAGVNAAFLTDSSKFRTCLGTFDPGFQYFRIECKHDTIYVNKYNRDFTIGKKEGFLIIQEKLRLSVLKSEGKYDN